jgi:hypothetical protein
MAVALSAAAALGILGLAGPWPEEDSSDSARATPADRGEWRLLAPVPGGREAGLSELEAVRTGRQVVIIAGASYDTDRVEALVYDPAQESWTWAPRSPLRWRAAAAVVTTGRQAIVWGGATNLGARGDAQVQGHGAVFDPRQRTWRRISAAPIGPRAFHSAVWSGDRMIVWGGVAEPYVAGKRARLRNNGASYDPALDRWTRLAPAPLRPRRRHVSVWTGRRMIVWGGEVDTPPGNAPLTTDGAIYDPRRDRWRTMRRAPIRWMPDTKAAWTGSEMLVWTGADLLSYDPAANRWRRLPPPPWKARIGTELAWTGEELVIWGGVRGICGRCYLRSREGSKATDTDGVAYRPDGPRRWRLLPRSPLAPRDRHAVVGLGAGRFIVWGGCCAGSRRRSNGALYSPPPLRPADVGHDLAATCRAIDATAAVRCPTWLPAPPARDDGPAVHVANADFDGSDCGYLTELHLTHVDDFTVHPYHVWFGGRCRPFPLRGESGRWPPRPNERDFLALVVTAPERPGQRRRTLVRPRVTGVTSVGGRRALVLRVDPFPRGGLHGGHYVLVWNEDGDGYMLSFHHPRGDRRRPPTLAQLSALSRAAASMRPAEELGR